MKTQVVLASTNVGKVRELASLFADSKIVLVGMDGLVPTGFSVEETGATFEENAWLKAEQVCIATGLPALADDSGLEVDALGGRPGVKSARYAGATASDEENNDLLLRELSGVPDAERSARFVCVLCLCEPTEEGPRRVFETRGSLEGFIGHGLRGEAGFGYDPLFLAQGLHGRTTAEISAEEKNRLSHRFMAARLMAQQLKDWAPSS